MGASVSVDNADAVVESRAVDRSDTVDRPDTIAEH
jgi:hypothetical protein